MWRKIVLAVRKMLGRPVVLYESLHDPSDPKWEKWMSDNRKDLGDFFGIPFPLDEKTKRSSTLSIKLVERTDILRGQRNES